MSLLNIAFLVLVVGAFTLYGLVLFVAWLLFEVLDKPGQAKAVVPRVDTPTGHDAREAA